MCMMDWRIGRLIRSVRTLKTVAAPASFTVKASQQRIAIMISMSEPLGPIYDSIGPSNPGLLISVGGVAQMAIDDASGPYYASLLNRGDIPTLAHLVTDADYGGGVCVTEWFLPERVLAVAITEFESEYGKWQA